MDVNITGRNMDLEPSLKRYIQKRMDKLGRIYKRIYKCEVVLEKEKERENAEIVLSLKRNRIVAKESSTDVYASIDNSYDSVKKQLRRLSGKLSSKRRKAVMDRFMRPMGRTRDLEELVIPMEEMDKDKIFKTNAFADKPMLPEEAKMELSITDKNFIMFKNAETGESNVIYKRNDGNFGLIEPNF